jgi:hypothetical protein
MLARTLKGVCHKIFGVNWFMKKLEAENLVPDSL